MPETARNDGYAASGLDAAERGRRRLQLGEQVMDEHTYASLGALPISPDWRCLEIGAGAGSVARWLAERLPEGEVVATDLDISHLPRDLANLTPLQHDIRTDDFPPGSFDLIHARAVLEHLPNGSEIVRRSAQWLRAGGWLVVEDVYLAPGADSPLPELRRITSLLLDTFEQVVGTDNQFGRRLPILLREAGLTGVGASYRGHPVGDAGPLSTTLAVSLQQLSPAMVAHGLARAEEVDALVAWLASNQVVDMGLMVVSAWGRQPLEQAADLR